MQIDRKAVLRERIVRPPPSEPSAPPPAEP